MFLIVLFELLPVRESKVSLDSVKDDLRERGGEYISIGARSDIGEYIPNNRIIYT